MGDGGDHGGQLKQEPPTDIPVKDLVQRAAAVVLLLWAWANCWLNICSNGVEVHHQWPNPEIRSAAALAVLVTGLLAVNVIGFLKYWELGYRFAAFVAAVGLDTPYLACAQGRQLVRGETSAEWEWLQIRSSCWRSLPLAMMTFVLSSRSVFEIPTCQATATLSSLAVAAFPHLEKESEWYSAMRRDRLDPAQIYFVNHTKWYAEKVAKSSKTAESEQLSRNALKVERRIWEAGHCNDSEWETERLPRSKDYVQHWIKGSPADLSTDGELGGIGSSNFLALNYVMYEGIKREILRNEKNLQPAVQRFLKRCREQSKSYRCRFLCFIGHKGAKHLAWKDFVDTSVSEFLARRSHEQVLSVKSSRPWTKKIAGVTLVNLAGAWKMQVAESFLLLLAAWLPIRKKVLASCGVTSWSAVAVVTFHTSLDMICLVTAWLLCAVQPSAFYIGKLVKDVMALLWPFQQMVLNDMSDFSDFDNDMPPRLAETLRPYGPGVLKIMTDNLIPALQWDKYFLLSLSAGSLMFLTVSAAVARVFCPQTPTATCLAVGLCGPLWLYTQETQAKDADRAATARGVCISIFSRAIMLGVIVAYTWSKVDPYSVQLYAAGISNRVVNVWAIRRCLLAFLAVHCLSGLLSICCVLRSAACTYSETDRFAGSATAAASSGYGTLHASEMRPPKDAHEMP